jgi:hypothetical protein
MHPQAPRTVNATGAAAGAVLQGIGAHNKGLRLTVLLSQPRGDDGPIKGMFQLLHPGDNKHSAILEGLLGWQLTAEELLKTLRRQNPQCVNVVNASALVVEKQ